MLYDEQRYIDSIHWQNSDNCPSGEDRNKTLKRVEVLYRQLKEKNINEHNWEYVSFWNFREKSIEMERHKLNGCFVEPVRRESLTRIKKLRHLFKYVGLRIYKFLSGYNESPLQAGMVLLLMFTGLGLVLLKNGESWDNLMDSLEVLPFIKTVKEVDGVSGWVRAGVIFFQTLITIQIALVIMSVRNKLRR